jgi:hypothetical protein
MVTFQGRTGREGTFGLQIDTNRSRLRRQRFVELCKHMDEGERMQPILLGRRRQLIEERKRQADEEKRRKFAEAQRLRNESAASSRVSFTRVSSLAPSSSVSNSQAAPAVMGQVHPRSTASPQPAALGNVVAHNLDLKPSKTKKVIPEGFALKIPSVSEIVILFFS